MISVVVPTLNAGEELSKCLQAFTGPEQLIIADGGSTDETLVLAAEAGAEVVRTSPGRGHQLQSGAAAATGEWLLFVHADSFLDPQWRSAAEEHMRRSPAKAAYFRLRLRSEEWPARIVERAVELRCRLFGLPYGDQGLLVPRSLYDEVGGFAAIPLMEDVDLVRRIGRRRLAPLEARAWTSARRWEQEGWASRSGRNLACLGLYLLGAPPAAIRKVYC